jgi:hypothetical protein
MLTIKGIGFTHPSYTTITNNTTSPQLSMQAPNDREHHNKIDLLIFLRVFYDNKVLKVKLVMIIFVSVEV